MNNKDDYSTVILAGILAVLVIFFICIVAIDNASTKKAFSEAIEAGVYPIEASCALNINKDACEVLAPRP